MAVVMTIEGMIGNVEERKYIASKNRYMFMQEMI
jgi:hypothetical protein